MNKKTPALLLASIGMALLLADLSPAVAQTILLSDDFTNSSPDRDPGDPIGGVPIQFTTGGSTNWVAITGDTNTVFGTNSLETPAAGQAGARVALPAYGPSLAMTVQAEITFDSIVFSWTAVGFQRTDVDSIFDASNAFGFIQPTGTTTANWNLFGAGVGDPIGSGGLTSFNFAVPHTLALTYDPTVGSFGALSLLVDGVNVSGVVALSAGNQITSLTNATIYQTDTAGSMNIDNFEVSQVPEPSSVALVFGVCGYALVLRMKSARRRD